MRSALVACASLLLLTTAMAGCFDRSGTLTIRLKVEDQGAVDDFSTLNIVLKDVRIKAKTLNLENYPVTQTRLELHAAATSQQEVELFKQSVRADTYERIELTTQGTTFQGTSATDQSTIGVAVPNGVFISLATFDVPRGGSATFVLAIQVTKNCTGTGSCTYSVVAYPEGSGVA